jgi:glycogen(starch) synthase
MKASVVINTYNRGPYLRAAIRSIATQSFRDTELVVVNGPSTDNTEEVLAELRREGYQFKLMTCASRNLSESRNIGIAGSAGDVVFFIDDDAVAHPRWVERLMRPYSDREVGAVGGFTIDHTGMAFQCRYTVCDRLGNAQFMSHLDPERLLRAGTGFAYPSLLGTNSSFRRNDLLRIGGFDEVFAYMLDETDVCARIFDLGRRIVTVPEAYVLHKYAPSHTRTAERIPGSLLAPARSKSYFVLKHANGSFMKMEEAYAAIARYQKDIEFSNRWFLDHKKVSVEHYEKLQSELRQGVAQGIALGADAAQRERKSPHLSTPHPLASAHLELRADERYRTMDRSLRIYFVSQGYPPADCSGIARWTHECAQGLIDLGHEVHVITRSPTEGSFVDVVDGVWVHFVVDTFDDERTLIAPLPVPDSLLRRAEAVAKEIERAQAIWGVDVVSAPIWDLEGLLCIEQLDVPVVTSLHTTYKLALPFKPEWQSNLTYRRKHVDLVINAERWLLDNSSSILANSNEVVREIGAGYGVEANQWARPIQVVHHGLGSAPEGGDELPRKGTEPLQILFVGRLEPRKGPDTLLAALAQLPADIPPCKLSLVGQPPGADHPFFQALLAEAERVRSKLPQIDIEFVGFVSDAQLEVRYAGCDIFVAPSRFESFGLILLEAMRWSKAVIAGDIGGMREVISDGVSGLLFAPEDPALLAQRLTTLARDGDLRRQLGEKALERYESQFTRERMAIGLERFFAAVVHAGK